MSDMVGNPEDRFSRLVAQSVMTLFLCPKLEKYWTERSRKVGQSSII